MSCSMFCGIFSVSVVEFVDIVAVSYVNTCIAVYFAVPVVELVNVLDVSKHDVVLVGETRRDVL